jgi:hypothetical protein
MDDLTNEVGHAYLHVAELRQSAGRQEPRSRSEPSIAKLLVCDCDTDFANFGEAGEAGVERCKIIVAMSNLGKWCLMVPVLSPRYTRAEKTMCELHLIIVFISFDTMLWTWHRHAG